MSYAEAFGILLTILVTMIREYSGLDQKIEGDTDELRVSKVIQVIKNNFYRSINIRDISSYCNMPIERFAALFKEQIGTSFEEYVHTNRIELSKKLIRDNMIPINEIAVVTGYDDLIDFVKWFNKMEGISPYKYFDSLTGT